jgi:type I restriction enzyme S subunit
VASGVFDCPHSTPKLDSDGPAYLARTPDVSDGVFRYESASRVSIETYNERIARAKPTYGDLLYSREGTYFGAAAEVPDGLPVCLGQRMVLIRPNSEVLNHRFLRFWLNSDAMASYVQAHKDGSVAQRLNLPVIRSIPVPLPPRYEQDEIAETLGAVDDKIESNRRAQMLCLSLGRARFDEFASNSDKVPLGKIATLVLGGTPSKSRADYWSAGSVPWINSGAANEDVIGVPSALISEQALAESSAKMMPAGASVIAITGATLGQVALLGIPTSGNQSLVGVWADDPQLTAWLHFAVHNAMSDLLKTATGAAQQHVNKGNVAELRVAVVDRAQLSAWAAVSEPLVRRAVQLASESLDLMALRDTLAPELLSGRRRLETEVAA